MNHSFDAFSKMLLYLVPEVSAQVIPSAGNLTNAAGWMGVDRLKMRDKLKEYGLFARDALENQ